MNVKRLSLKIWALLICLVSALTVEAQTLDASGRVVDSDDSQPIPGVAVMVKGTTSGTVTDMDGKFNLKAGSGDILVFSFIGYSTVELPAASNMEVSLETDSKALEDVIVIGYGVARKTDLTGAVTAIRPDEKNHGLITNAQDMLAGKIAGVNVMSDSGTPGGGAKIRIRGGSSLNASNDPLVVIDGLAMDNDGVKGLANPLSMVNPADIETFTVLKDASATAIYGSRGSNGVIIITTKKGSKNGNSRPVITYNGNVGVSFKVKEIEVFNGDEYREFVTNLYGAGSEAVSKLGTESSDWQDAIYRTAKNTDHNLTVSGGNKNLTYRVSAGYTGQEGLLKTSDFRRGTLSFNLSPTLLDEHLTFNINAKGMLAKSRFVDTGVVGAAIRMDPTKPIYSDAEEYKNFGGYWQWLTNGATLNDPEWPWLVSKDHTHNPLATLEQKDDTAISKSVIGNVEGTYKVHGLEDLILHGNFGFDYSTGKQDTKLGPETAENYYYGWDGYEQIDKYNLSLNAFIQYNKDFNDDNHFDIMGGYEWQHFYKETKNEGSGVYPETNNDVSLRGKPYNANDKLSKTEHYIVSFFGRANYTLLNRYMLTATVRYDGSSRFFDHWALFPSGAFAWKVKEEPFLRDVDAVSDLKVRLGYGKTGQQEGIGDYNYFATYNINTNPGSKYPLLEDGRLNRPDAINKELKWETTTTYNVGLDLGFIDNRFTLSADVYKRKTTDLLNQVYVSAGSNFRNQIMSNIGSLENTGAEIALTLRPVQTSDWQWELSLNGAYNKNEITELTGEEGYHVATGGISAGTGNTCAAHSVGYAANSFYVYQQVYDENGDPIEGLVVDRNGDGKISEADLYHYKSPLAPYTFGLANRLQYKNIDFSFSLRGSYGNYVYNNQESDGNDVGQASIYSLQFLQNRPRANFERNWQSKEVTSILSDIFVQNASFIKCDNITLGYSFKSIGSLPLNGRVHASATNVFTITKYKGLDPEAGAEGIDSNIFPRPLSVQLGLMLTF